jgi:CRISPR-associated protein (TIGR03986 family)
MKGNNVMPNAITPYNFVPMPDRIIKGEEPPDRSRYHTDRCTGWFDIELTTLTPVYTRAARSLDQNDNDNPQPDFFHYLINGNDQPVIPGSGLRGMIRSVFEIITCSRMDFISNRRLFYRSFASIARNWAEDYRNSFMTKKRLVAGVLIKQNGGWVVRVSDNRTSSTDILFHRGFYAVSVDDAGLKSINSNLYDSSGTHCKVRPYFYKYSSNAAPSANEATLLRNAQSFNILEAKVVPSGGQVGWLISPGKDVNHRHYYQFIINPILGTCRDYPMDDKVYADYEAWGQLAHGSNFGKPEFPRHLVAGDPVFALLDNAMTSANARVSVIGANMMMPLRYSNSIDVIAKNGVVDCPGLDMAQSVFGFVANGRSNADLQAVKSRVYFEDAKCTSDSQYLQNTPDEGWVPDILSGPKPTSFQTYLTQPKSNDWVHWDTAKAKIRGSKLYWHRSPQAAMDSLHQPAAVNLSASQITHIKPVKEGVVFKGRIRFENLSNKELGALYASIHLPNGLAHKFGMGKNLGLGSVRIEVKQTVLFDMKNRLRSLSPLAGVLNQDNANKKLALGYRALLEVVGAGNSLWGNERMRSLSALLSWDHRPQDSETCQVTAVDNDPQNQWRRKYHLSKALDMVNYNATDIIDTDVQEDIPWQTATLVLNPGNGELKAILQDGKAVKVQGNESVTLRNTLPEEMKAKLKKKKTLSLVMVQTKPLGSDLKIIGLKMPDTIDEN